MFFKAKIYEETVKLDYIHYVAFLKIYTCLRVIKDWSPLNTNTGRFIGTFTKVEYSDKFLIKTWLKANPILSLLCFAVLIISISSYLIYISERYYVI